MRNSPTMDGAKSIAVTIVLAIFAGVLATSATLSDATQWDVGNGLNQLWTVLTCHFTHWSLNHLVWDLLAFVVLGAMCERMVRRRYYETLVLSAIVIPLLVTGPQSAVQTYRGLSGLDSALFTLLACEFARCGIRYGNRQLSVVAVLAWLLFIGKTIFEVNTGGLIFVSDPSFVPLPMSHIVGAVVGTSVALRPNRFRAAVVAKATSAGSLHS